MAKKKYFRTLPSSSINLDNFSVYKINKDKTIIYRCRFCFKGKIKKKYNIYIRIAGHEHNCYLNNKILSKKNITKIHSIRKENNSKLIIDKNQLINDFNNNKSINSIKDNEDNINYNDTNNIFFKNKDRNDNKKDKIKRYSKIKNKNYLLFPQINFETPSNITTLCNEINIEYNSYISTLFKDYNVFNCFELGSGGYGFCYFGISKKISIPCAIKISHEKNLSELDKEAEFLEKLRDIDFFPKLIGLEKGDEFSPYIAEELMGPTLRKLYNFCENKIDIKTLCNIGIDIISCLHSIHRKDILHGDIKCSNICWNILNNININPDLVLIDFGRSEYIKDIGNNKKKGNDYYKAVEIIEKIKLSKEKEMIVVMYILLHLYIGTIPWKKKIIIIKLEKKNFLELKKISIL